MIILTNMNHKPNNCWECKFKNENADIIDGYYVPKYECPYCHTWKDDDSNFCPDCGMIMRERENKNNEYNTNNN